LGYCLRCTDVNEKKNVAGRGIETFEKCSILFKFKPPARGAYAPEGKANPPPNFGGLTTPYDLPDLRGRHEYMEYFEDKAKASLRAKC